MKIETTFVLAKLEKATFLDVNLASKGFVNLTVNISSPKISSLTYCDVNIYEDKYTLLQVVTSV